MRERDTFEGLKPIQGPVENETAWLLGQGLRVMHLGGEEGERQYGHVIRLLRADPRAAAAVADLAITKNSLWSWRSRDSADLRKPAMSRHKTR